LIKRVADLLLSIAALVAFFPIIIFIIILIKIFLGSPIIFSQVRPGIYGKPFTMYKFRTMKNLYNINGEFLQDSERLTKFGSFLRSSSLDELPELVNVIKGDMSLVGPRPLLMEYLPLFNEFQSRRHNVKPGITGWSQVNGRNALNWEQKFKLDIWYVENRNFILDIKIIMITIKKVIIREGINSSPSITMEKFKGN
jgi:lipopolysaccharide/colanic/teichoic acid biosynthesis glycosyltransferase